MLRRISISNFKSIKSIADLELKPLTLLTGVNSSGKSNIMEAIAFYAQASRFQETQDSRPTIESVFRLGEIKQYPRNLESFIVHKGDPRETVTIGISVDSEKSLVDNISGIVSNARAANIDIERYVFPHSIDDPSCAGLRTIGYSVSFRFSDRAVSQSALANGRPFLEVGQVKGERLVTIPRDFRRTETGRSLEGVFDEQIFRAASHDTPAYRVLSEVARQVVMYVKECARHYYFISGERGQISPEELIELPPRGRPPIWIGSNGQHLMEILSRCFTRRPERSKKIREWSERFQLADLRAGYTERNVLESNFSDETLQANLNSALAGLGSRQILSIITQIFWSEAPSVIMIEEPEISLHPENQVLLHELFAEAISEGKQIICSTHSPFFVLALSKIIKKKLLPLDDVAVYHVKKDKGGTDVESLKLNRRGFVDKGVPSFMKVEKDLFRDWSESLEEE